MASRSEQDTDAPGDTYVVMGRIGAPWGVKGWVKLFSYTDPPENLLDYRVFRIIGPTGQQDIEIDEARPQGQGLVGHIKGCDEREASGRFTGCELQVPKQSLPALDEEYYWHQLEGLRVHTLQGEDLGRVHHLMETGANDVLVVRGDEQSLDREERLLPWVRGQVVKEVDLEHGVILVDWDKDF